MEVIDGVSRDSGVVFSFCQYEGALKNRLGVQSKALRRPICVNPMTLDCRGYVSFQFGRVVADAGVAGSSDCRR